MGEPIQCPPYCRVNCAIPHHQLLLALLQCTDGLPENTFRAKIRDLRNTIKTYAHTSHNWRHDDPIPDPIESYRIPLLHWATSLGRTKVVPWLMQNGFKLGTQHPSSGENALHQALASLQETCPKEATKKFQEMLEFLYPALLQGNNDGRTPLHYCCNMLTLAMPRPEFFKECITIMLDQAQGKQNDFMLRFVNCQDNAGDTALHLLAECMKPIDTTMELLMAGADLKVTNKKGLTAMDVSIQLERPWFMWYVGMAESGKCTEALNVSEEDLKLVVASSAQSSVHVKNVFCDESGNLVGAQISPDSEEKAVGLVATMDVVTNGADGVNAVAVQKIEANVDVPGENTSTGNEADLQQSSSSSDDNTMVQVLSAEELSAFNYFFLDPIDAPSFVNNEGSLTSHESKPATFIHVATNGDQASSSTIQVPPATVRSAVTPGGGLTLEPNALQEGTYIITTDGELTEDALVTQLLQQGGKDGDLTGDALVTQLLQQGSSVNVAADGIATVELDMDGEITHHEMPQLNAPVSIAAHTVTREKDSTCILSATLAESVLSSNSQHDSLATIDSGVMAEVATSALIDSNTSAIAARLPSKPASEQQMRHQYSLASSLTNSTGPTMSLLPGFGEASKETVSHPKLKGVGKKSLKRTIKHVEEGLSENVVNESLATTLSSQVSEIECLRPKQTKLEPHIPSHESSLHIQRASKSKDASAGSNCTATLTSLGLDPSADDDFAFVQGDDSKEEHSSILSSILESQPVSLDSLSTTSSNGTARVPTPPVLKSKHKDKVNVQYELGENAVSQVVVEPADPLEGSNSTSQEEALASLDLDLNRNVHLLPDSALILMKPGQTLEKFILHCSTNYPKVLMKFAKIIKRSKEKADDDLRLKNVLAKVKTYREHLETISKKQSAVVSDIQQMIKKREEIKEEEAAIRPLMAKAQKEADSAKATLSGLQERLNHCHAALNALESL